MSTEHERFLAVALDHAVTVWGNTSPNPPVGCVVVRDSVIVGVGGTSPAGGPHAEVVALAAAGSQARGATVYVTLEPCNHTGRTGPCVDALIAAGVSAVYYAVEDPNPAARGGAQRLRSHGIEVHSGVSETDVRKGPLRAWLHRQRTGRPHVRWKYAATLDGRAAALDGSSQWISSTTSRAYVHQLRSRCDAIVVGTATVRADDPALTARRPDSTLHPHQPTPYVVGRTAIPEDALLAGATRFATHDVSAVLAELGERGHVDVLLEGGPTLAGAFLAAGAIDLVEAFVAPTFLGAGRAALGPAGVETIGDALDFDIEQVLPSGRDLHIIAVPTRS